MNKKHIIKEGDREHVLSWDSGGAHCSEPECEVNKMKKRTSVFIMPPGAYEVSCDLCGGEVEWSEYEHMVWCAKCEKDTVGSEGIFDGPIPIETALLGLSLDKIDLATGKRLYIKIKDRKVVWEEIPDLEGL